MNIVQWIGVLMGLGLAAGLRLYATVLALGLAIRFHLLELRPEMAHLGVLADTRVLAVAAIACLAEFLADKVPWIDTAWDAVHTVVRPVGAGLLGVAAVGAMDPAAQAILGLLCGSVALTGHSAKAATRLAANHSPEPFSNLALSLAEDALAPAALWMAFRHPYVTFSVVGAFLVVFAVLAPRIFRLLRLELSALSAAIQSVVAPTLIPAEAPLSGVLAGVAPALAVRALQLPEPYAAYLARKSPAAGRRLCVRCAAGGNIRGLRHSLGYLCVGGEALEFIARRWFRFRTAAIPLAGVSRCRFEPGLILGRLDLDSGASRQSFFLFRR